MSCFRPITTTSGKNIATGEIYNGADDDGSGTCSLLEIAHAFTSMKSSPKRSLLFLSFAGEEKGLLGSLYYTNIRRFRWKKQSQI